MKNLIFLSCIFCCIACQQPKQQYFESGPEIDKVKGAVQAYLNKDWNALRSIYADTAKFAGNTFSPEKFVNLDKHMADEKAAIENFTDIKISNDPVYVMVVTDKGEKWVLFWATWTGKTKDGKEVSVALHEGLRFVGDKVVFHLGIYNELPFYLAFQPSDSTSKK